MNRLVIGDGSEPVLDEDALVFYAKISEVVGTDLDPAKDVLALKVPPWNSRNSAQYARICDKDSNRRVCLKRCTDSSEFIRRELLIPQIKNDLEFPSYKVVLAKGIVLRSPSTGRNCTLVQGWENKDTLLIDYGDSKTTESMATLQLGSVTDLVRFCYSYGKWCAFDYLFGVRDRNPGNFVYFKETGELQSVDNEEGPFSTDGKFMGVEDILIQTRQNIERFVIGNDRLELVHQIRRGFVEAWHTIAEKAARITILSMGELNLLMSLLKEDSMKVSEVYS